MKRFALFTDKESFDEALPRQADKDFIYKANFNISKGESVPALHQPKKKLILDSMIWGWESKGHESMLSLSMDDISVDGSEKTTRCLIPANGFYVWKHGVDDPYPFYIRMINEPLFFMAALYRDIKDDSGHNRHHFCLIEETANELVKAVNPMMPLIISNDQFDAWLNGEDLKSFASENDPLQLGSFITARVSERVNNSSENDSELIQPIPKLRDSDD